MKRKRKRRVAMSNVFVYRWVEISRGEETWYGSFTRYEQALSRKKGYEEAVIGGLVFCTYASGPLLLYTDDTKGTAFEIASDITMRRIRESSQGGSLASGLNKAGLSVDAAKRVLGGLSEDVGIMANPDNAGKFHLLRVSLHTGKDDRLYELDHGRWRYGGSGVYALLKREYETWGKGG
jgi:hypothetical protein